MYRSKYEAYPFLCDNYDDLRCDFEIFTDHIATQIGVLINLVKDKQLNNDLLKICEMVYHLNPTLRTKKFSITNEEIDWLIDKSTSLQNEFKDIKFVLTVGCEKACIAHLLRVDCKALTRMVYRFLHQGNQVDDRVLDVTNLLSGYFFYLALFFNKEEKVEEKEFVSRNYK